MESARDSLTQGAPVEVLVQRRVVTIGEPGGLRIPRFLPGCIQLARSALTLCIATPGNWRDYPGSEVMQRFETLVDVQG
eukprot:7392785-Pyramimonas_sp.AAC.1